MQDDAAYPTTAELELPVCQRIIVNVSPGALLLAGIPVALGAGLIAPELGLLLLVGFLGIVGGVISVLRPGIGLFLFSVMLYSRASEVLTTSLGIPSIAPLFTIWLLTGVIMHHGFGGLFHARPTGWQALVVYGLVLLASTLVATNPWVASYRVVDYQRELIYIALIVTCARQLSDLRIVARAMLIGGTIPALLTIYQTLSGSTNSFLGFARYSEAIVIPGEIVEIARPSGMIGDPNFYALALIPLIPLAFHRARWERSLLARQLSLLAALTLAVAAIMTYSRGGYLTLAAVVVGLIIAGFISFRSVLLVVLLFLALLPVLPDSYSGRVSSLFDVPRSVLSQEPPERGTATDTSVSGRVTEVMSGVHMFLDHPILGVGANNYPEHYQEYARPMGVDRRVQRAPHNLYVEIAAETGIVGLFAFGALIGSLFVALRRVWKTTNRGTEFHDFALAVAVSLAALLISSIFLHFAYPRYLMVFFGLAMAVASVQNWRVTSGSRFRFSPLRLPEQLLSPDQRRRLVLSGSAVAIFTLAVITSVALAISIDPSKGALFERTTSAAIEPRPGLLAAGHAATPTDEAAEAISPNAGVSNPEPTAPVDIAIQAQLLLEASQPIEPRSECVFVADTQHNVCGDFATFFTEHGAQEIFGNPLTEEFITDGTLVQYFERARFEWHQEGDAEGNHVLLARLGVQRYVVQAGREVDPIALPEDDAGCIYEDATGHNVCGSIVYYWISHGGAKIFGFPITERTDEAGTTVQYFERARLELRQGSDGDPVIVISPLGKEEVERILALSGSADDDRTAAND